MKIDVKNCPNCGASIEHKYNHQCPYCKTLFDFNVEKTKEINPKYMENVKIRAIERTLELDRIRIIFTGDYRPYSDVLEYGKDMATMIIDYESFIPKKVAYAISIPVRDFCEFDRIGNIEVIFEHLPFELDKREIYKALMEFRSNKYGW